MECDEIIIPKEKQGTGNQTDSKNDIKVGSIKFCNGSGQKTTLLIGT